MAPIKSIFALTGFRRHINLWKAAVMVAGMSLAIVSTLFLVSPPPASSPLTTDAYSFPFGQTIDLTINEEEMMDLRERRQQALDIGILQDDDSSWVKAKFAEGKREFPAKLRLKGDWTDHLKGEKWSFRVELKDSTAWRRLITFSLQSPDRRGYLNEWLFHQVLAREGLLTPRYDFVYLRLNGRMLGTYAVEEHFTKQLLESQQRREGPILKLDETGMWDARIASLHDPTFPYLQIPFFQAAPVVPFKKGRVLKNSLLHMAFDNAQRLMAQYRAGRGQPSHVFDIELAARQYALTDLFGAYHSLIWHNRRYYFNPFTQLLEPVIFDGFDGLVQDMYIRQPFWGYGLCGNARDDADYRDVTSVYVFQDPAFVRAYHRALFRYCAPAYLDSVMRELAPGIREREQFLRGEEWGYALETGAFVANASRINSVLRDSLQAERIILQDLELGAGRHHITVSNHNPLPIEVFMQADAVQFLEADAGQANQKTAVFWLEKDDQVYWRLPGSAQKQILIIASQH